MGAKLDHIHGKERAALRKEIAQLQAETEEHVRMMTWLGSNRMNLIPRHLTPEASRLRAHEREVKSFNKKIKAGFRARQPRIVISPMY